MEISVTACVLATADFSLLTKLGGPFRDKAFPGICAKARCRPAILNPLYGSGSRSPSSLVRRLGGTSGFRRFARCSQMWRATPPAASRSAQSETRKAIINQCMTAKVQNTRWSEANTARIRRRAAPNSPASNRDSRGCQPRRAAPETPACRSCAVRAAALRERPAARRRS